MALSPRWLKIVRDVLRSKFRTALVVLSIAIGVVGVGMLGQIKFELFSGMADSLASANPASATLVTDPFDNSTAEAVRKLSGIADVEARTRLDVRIAPDLGERQPAAEQWHNMQIQALDDFSAKRMDKLVPAQGDWPPVVGDIALEQTALTYAGISVGDRVWIEMPDGHTVRLRVTGAVRDVGRIPASLSGVVVGYIMRDTLETLDVPKLYNRLAFQPTGDKTNADNIQNVAGHIRDEFSNRGISVHATEMPEPGKHWAYTIVDSMNYILQSLGFLVLVLGSSLIVNTMLATLTGQMRQIGVMQVIGATPKMLIRLYFGNVLIYSGLAIVVGIPLGMLGAKLSTHYSITIMNFDTSGYAASPTVWMLQIAVGLVIPMVAALLPILSGTRITAREAIAGGVSRPFGWGYIDRLLEKLRGLPRPLLLSLRNTFRKKGRLLLTLITLSIGCAIVISVISVYDSLQLSINNSLRYVGYDVSVIMTEPQPNAELNRIASQVPGIISSETWGQRIANRVRPQGGESRDLTLQGVPVNSALIEPKLEKGRWLQQADKNDVVVNTDILRYETDLDVGSEVRLKIDGNESVWTVVGLARLLGSEVAMYTSDTALGKVSGDGARSTLLQVVTDEHNRASQAHVAEELQAKLKENDYHPASAMLATEIRQVKQNNIGVVLAFLVVMAGLMIVVATIGLMSTMSLSVLDRTREIGVMRSIGASDRSVFGIVIGEGVFIGFIAWIVGSILALPISKQLSGAIGRSIFFAPLDYRFSIAGVFICLAGAMLISAAASFAPAWNATRLAVRDVITYE